jgi:flagellar basal-body rod protein FlgC
LERLKLDTISTNIANVNTTRTEDGGPYIKKTVTFEENVKQSQSALSTGKTQKSFGVKATGMEEDDSDLVREYNPESPDADENGYVTLPNVNMADEMVDMMTTLRTYEANATALEASKNMLKQALQISAK